MKKILFIPTYTYLTTPVFINLLSELKVYETIYLDVEDQYQCEKTSKEFKDNFSKSIKLHINADNLTFIDKVMKFFKMYKFQGKLKKVIKQESPAVIITTGDLTFSVRIIKKYFPNIPIVVIQSALFGTKGIHRTYTKKLSYIFFNKILRIPIVNRQTYFGQEFKDMHLLVWGECFKRMLPNEKNVHIVGDITFDNFPIEQNNEERKVFLEKSKFALDGKIVTICTSVLESFVEKQTIDDLYEIYKNLITKHKDLFFIIKPHPRNNTKKLRNIFQSLPVNNCIVLNTHVHELFKYTDIHISTFSATAIQAIASKIPIINVNPNNAIKLEDFLNNELHEKVTNPEEMYNKIKDILNNRDSYLALGEKYIKNRLFKLDGNATKRASDIIKRVIDL